MRILENDEKNCDFSYHLSVILKGSGRDFKRGRIVAENGKESPDILGFISLFQQ